MQYEDQFPSGVTRIAVIIVAAQSAEFRRYPVPLHRKMLTRKLGHLPSRKAIRAFPLRECDYRFSSTLVNGGE
jgi:hypothetical protein